MRVKSDRVGEKRLMKNGLMAEIIKYQSAEKVLIRFADGTMRETSYAAFVQGTTRNPNINVHSKVGEKRLMKNGQQAEIIKYIREDDIDILFEDGTIIEHKVYGNFKKGLIGNPNKESDGRVNGGRFTRKDFTGLKAKMKNGLEAEIIRYGRFDDIDVRFENGVVVKHKQMSAFRNGQIGNPLIHRSSGEIMIIEYLIENNVYFEQEYSFGDLKGKRGKQKLRFDFAIFDTDGNAILLIEYQGKQHYETVEFFGGQEAFSLREKYDKQKRKFCRANSIKLLELTYDCENIGQKLDNALEGKKIKKTNYSVEDKKRHIMWYSKVGLQNLMSNGQRATIIAYRRTADIDVEFEDGTIIQGVALKNFEEGYIRNPNALPLNPQKRLLHKNQINRCGQQAVMNNGQTATIIAYRSTLDIDVVFDDKTVVKHKTYNNFKLGSIRNPNLHAKYPKDCIRMDKKDEGKM